MNDFKDFKVDGGAFYMFLDEGLFSSVRSLHVVKSETSNLSPRADIHSFFNDRQIDGGYVCSQLSHTTGVVKQ